MKKGSIDAMNLWFGPMWEYNMPKIVADNCYHEFSFTDTWHKCVSFNPVSIGQGSIANYILTSLLLWCWPIDCCLTSIFQLESNLINIMCVWDLLRGDTLQIKRSKKYIILIRLVHSLGDHYFFNLNFTHTTIFRYGQIPTSQVLRWYNKFNKNQNFHLY